MYISIGAQGRTPRGNLVNPSLWLEKKAEDATCYASSERGRKRRFGTATVRRYQVRGKKGKERDYGSVSLCSCVGVYAYVYVCLCVA
jgi:hypothetical protein